MLSDLLYSSCGKRLWGRDLESEEGRGPRTALESMDVLQWDPESLGKAT